MKYLNLSLLAVIFSFHFAAAQHVKVQLGFPAGVAIRPSGPAPYAGAIWIGPEWRWQGGRYVHVPGYWCHPKRHHRNWKPGFWKLTRRGYVWIPGRWR